MDSPVQHDVGIRTYAQRDRGTSTTEVSILSTTLSSNSTDEIFGLYMIVAILGTLSFVFGLIIVCYISYRLFDRYVKRWTFDVICFKLSYGFLCDVDAVRGWGQPVQTRAPQCHIEQQRRSQPRSTYRWRKESREMTSIICRGGLSDGMIELWDHPRWLICRALGTAISLLIKWGKNTITSLRSLI